MADNNQQQTAPQGPTASAIVDELLSRLSGEEDEDEGSGLGFVGQNGQQLTDVYLNRDSYDHGHLLDRSGDGEPTPVPLPNQAIRGYLTDIQYYLRQSEFGPSQKLRLFLDCGDEGEFMIETGFFTNTAKSLVSDLAEIDPSQPVRIIPDPSDGDSARQQKVLFVNIEQNGDYIQGEWPDTNQEVVEFFDIVREQVLGLERQEERPQPNGVSSSGTAGAAQNGAPAGNGTAGAAGGTPPGPGGGNAPNQQQQTSSAPAPSAPAPGNEQQQQSSGAPQPGY